MVISFSPIALFIYRRPEHTARMIQSLMTCPEFGKSPIYVFADGPKEPADDLPRIREAREMARLLLGRSAVYFESETNKGLAESIIEGVSMVCDVHGRVIVLEDDLIVSNQFLSFMNMGLERYAEEARVLQISGFMYDVRSLSSSEQGLFLPLALPWGWATWKRAWDLFDPNPRGWAEVLREPGQRRMFNLNGHFPFYRMMRKQMSGDLDSWFIRWYFTLFTQGGLSLFPPASLVFNAGRDGSGTHYNRSQIQDPMSNFRTIAMELPVLIGDAEFHNIDVYKAMRKFLFNERVAKIHAMVRKWFSSLS